MAIAISAILLLLLSTRCAADCSYDWRIEKGDLYRSGQSCFDSATSGPTFTELPATAQFFRMIDGVSVAIVQTGSLDLVAINKTTGEVLWDTYNASSDLALHLAQAQRPSRTTAGGATPRPPCRRCAKGLPTADASSSSRTLDSHRHRSLQLGIEPPQQVVTGTHDAVRNLMYVEQGGTLTAVVAATGPGTYVPLQGDDATPSGVRTDSLPGGHVVWSIGLDGQGDYSVAWQGTSMGRSLLVPATLPASPNVQSDVLLMVLDVFSVYGGVVTSAWLAAVDLNSPQVLWASPIVPGALTRAGCLWPPLFVGPEGSSPSHVLLTCDTDKLAQSTQNTTILAYSLADGSSVWNSSLWNGSLTSSALPPVPYSNAAWYTAPQRLSSCTAASTQCMYAVGTSQPGNPGLWTFVTSTSGDTLLEAKFIPAASLIAAGTGQSAPIGGPQGQLFPVPGASQIITFTSDGSVVGLNPATLLYDWVIPLHLPAVSTNANWGLYYMSAWTHDPETSTAWMTWANMNGSSALVGVQVVHGAEGVLVYSGWPSSLPGLSGSGPLPYAEPLPVALPPTQGEATKGVNLLVLGYSRIPTAIRIPVTPSGTGEVSFQWTLPTRGAVWSSPILITNPANASQGVLIYNGLDDGIIYAIDPNSEDPAVPVWMTDGSFLDQSLSACLGMWQNDLLVCVGSFGSLAMWSLTNGTLLAVTDMREYWANGCASVPFPAYTSGIVLLDDEDSSSGLSILLLVAAMPPNESVNALIRLPLATASEDWRDVNDDDGAPIPWWTFYPAWPGASTPPSQRVDIAWQTTAAAPNYGREFSVSAFNTSGALFVPRSYQSLQSLSLNNGSLLWSSNSAYPAGQGGWYINGIAYAPVSDIIVAAFLNPQFHEDEDRGLVSAVRGRDGSLLWQTPRLCVARQGGITIEPWHASRGAGESVVYVSCSNAGPAGLQGKIVILSATTGDIVGYAGRPDGAMVSDVTLIPLSSSLSAAATGATASLVYGASGGLVAAYNASSLQLRELHDRRVRDELEAATADDDTDDNNDDQPGNAGILQALGRTRLPGSATAVEWTYLNFYPSFTFSFVSDRHGVLYAAGGDDRNAYIIRLPGLLCPCAEASNGAQSIQCCSGGPAPALPSPSASALPAPAQDVGPPAVAIGVGSAVGVAVLGVAAALFWCRSRQKATMATSLGSGRSSRALSEARLLMLQSPPRVPVGIDASDEEIRATLLGMQP